MFIPAQITNPARQHLRPVDNAFLPEQAQRFRKRASAMPRLGKMIPRGRNQGRLRSALPVLQCLREPAQAPRHLFFRKPEHQRKAAKRAQPLRQHGFWDLMSRQIRIKQKKKRSRPKNQVPRLQPCLRLSVGYAFRFQR